MWELRGLVRSAPDRTVLVQALAGDVVLCFWGVQFTLCASLHPGPGCSKAG